MKKSSTLDHALKYTGVFGGVQGLMVLIGFVRTKLATRFLGTAGYGLMAIYMSISEFVNNSTNFGIPFSSVRRMSELFETGSDAAKRHFVCVVRTWACWTALLAALVCSAAAPLLGQWFFEGDSHDVLSIVGLVPMVAALSITGGEISILKGLRRLRRVAAISVIGAITTLLLTIPFLWAWGMRGIIVALDVSSVAMMLIHLSYTLPLYSWKIAPFSRSIFQEGWKMIRTGVPYVLAGIAGAAVSMLLLGLMKRIGSQDDVGYYRIGYSLMATYAGFVYATFEADYFPRLSSVNHDVARCNETINQQIRVCLLLMAPLLIAMMTAMPIVIRILSSSDFLPASGMAICTSFYIFLRGISLPIGYMALARGDSKLYLLMEVIYDLVSLCLTVGCFSLWGIVGAGIGLSLSSLFDVFMLSIVYGRQYHVRISPATWQLAFIQALLVGVTLMACMMLPSGWPYAVGVPLFGLSAWRSYQILARETTFIEKIRNRLRL
ncbi:MAG: oligosaccharide flippase family protein [Bacteroidaceae bacterium]|nr:oligosaccharide flippase family protein [Bacteroidaceae bacterium]